MNLIIYYTDILIAGEEASMCEFNHSVPVTSVGDSSSCLYHILGSTYALRISLVLKFEIRYPLGLHSPSRLTLISGGEKQRVSSPASQSQWAGVSCRKLKVEAIVKELCKFNVLNNILLSVITNKFTGNLLDMFSSTYHFVVVLNHPT